MELNKSNMKKISFLIFFYILLLAIIQHFKVIGNIFNILLSVIMPFIVGLCIAFIINVLMNRIENKLFAPLNRKNKKLWKKIKRPVSLILSYIIIAGLFAFLILLLIPEIRKTSSKIAEDFPDYIKRVQIWLTTVMQKYNISTQRLQSIDINWDKIKDSVLNFFKRGGSTLFSTTLGITSSIFRGILNFVIGIVFSLYVLMQKEKLRIQIKKFLYAFLSQNKAASFLNFCSLANKTFANFIAGQCLEAVIIGVLCFIGMLILKIPYALLISTLIGFAALIPVFGSIVGTIIGTFLILMVNSTKALWFIIFILVLQQLEGNFIYPKVVGKSVGLPSIWMLVAVTIGGSLSGVLGMILSVPISSIIYSLLRSATYSRLDKRNITIHNADN